MSIVVIEIECQKCRGTGVYSGMAEPEWYAVICYGCQGSGREKFSYTPFGGRVRRNGIREVGYDKNPDGRISYKSFADGKMPEDR